MSIPTKTRSWVLQHKPIKAVHLDFTSPKATFALKTFDVPSALKPGEILVKTLYLSNDPGQRGWIQKGQDPERFYVPLVEEGDVMRSTGIGRVVKALEGGKAKEGDIVFTSPGWTEYAVVPDARSQVLKPIPGVPLSTFLGVLGVTGATAYFGLTDILQFKEGQSIIVTGAAGAVGSVAVQLAKKVFKASHVVGIAGSTEKLEWLKTLGADAVVNYKSPTFEQDLIEATPGFVNAIFDGIAGPVLGVAIKRVAKHGRIAAIGGTAAYNDSTNGVLHNYLEVVPNRLTIQGFIIYDYLHRFGEAITALSTAVQQGKIALSGSETVVDAEGKFEEIPIIWHRLFEEGVKGKLVTKIASE